jgi:hypothetical protein
MPLWEKGTSGFSLHGQRYCTAPLSMYDPPSIAPTAQINVSWQLGGSVDRESGGFCAIPGSHKAEFMLPGDRFSSIELPQVTHVPTEPGDVLMFLGSSVTHGASSNSSL